MTRRHSCEQGVLWNRPPRPIGAPRSGKQARSAARRLVLPGPPPTVRGSRTLRKERKQTHTKSTEEFPLELRIKTESVTMNRTPFLSVSGVVEAGNLHRVIGRAGDISAGLYREMLCSTRQR